MKIYQFNKVDSTQKIARDIIYKTGESEFIVIAKQQTKGYGRRQREWHSPPGGLYASIVLNIKTKNLNIIPLAVALAVRKAISEICKIDVKVKWPNDIIVNDRKLGGIITETILIGEKLKNTIIGIGLNINIKREQFPSELREKATSTLIETGKKFKIKPILNKVIEKIIRYLKLIENNLEKKLLNEWKKYDIVLGREIKILNEKEIEGYAVDIKDNGALILKRKDGKIIELYAEEISIKM